MIASGKVTFLFTDIEGSTRLAQKFHDTHHSILKRHNAILNDTVRSNDGYVFKTIGDAFCISFGNAGDAVRASVEIQNKLIKEDWGESDIKVRMGIHTGEAEYLDNDYIGYITLVRVQRLMSVANGGQILISGDTYSRTKDIKDEVSFRDMGERRLKDLVRPEHVYQVSGGELSQDFPPLKTLDARPNNLPALLTSYIGREKEMIVIKKLLSQSKLLTLLGTGGTGKTRLSISVGTDVIDEFANGVWFVELASISDPSFVAKEIASVLRLASDSNTKTLEIITDFLKDKELLLILDNCEHLIGECAKTADRLLSLCPKLKILTSSREPLRINGEMNFHVPPLSLPEIKEKSTPESITQYESVRLFIDRALSVNQQFRVTNSNAPHLAELCHRLDGIPLAIELASARIRVMTVEKILEKINDRFRLLTSGDRTALPRQQTLKALIDWSFDMLSEKEKLLFRRLSVFKGGWTIEAAEEVCSDNELDQFEILELLSNLSDKSLVVTKESEGNYRYDMLESIREYGNEKLTEKTGMRERHFSYLLKLCKERSETNGAEKVTSHKKIKREQENLRAAIEWSIEYDTKSAVQLVNEMGEVWELNGNCSEGLEIYKNIFAKEIQPGTELLGDAYISAGYLASQMGEYETSMNYLNQSLQIRKELNNKIKIAECLNNVGNLLFIKNEMEEAKRNHEEALSIGYEINDKLTISTSLINLASVDSFYKDYENALVKYDEGLVLMRELDDYHMIARILSQLAYSFTQTGNIEKARICYEESLPILKEFDDHIPVSISILHLGDNALSQSKFDEAEHFYEECLSITKEYGFKYIHLYALINLGILEVQKENFLRAKELYCECVLMCDAESDRHQLATCFFAIANYYHKLKKFEFSARAYGVSENIFSGLGLKLPKGDVKMKLNMEDVIPILGKEKFDEYFKEGKALSLDEAISMVNSQ